MMLNEYFKDKNSRERDLMIEKRVHKIEGKVDVILFLIAGQFIGVLSLILTVLLKTNLI